MTSFKWMALACLFVFSFQISNAQAQAAQKKWTFMVFLNGNNNLDDYGDMNIRQMEEIGSSQDVNIVVQWASLKKPDVKRILIQKRTANADESEVSTSPVVENLGSADMGDYRSLVDFVKWGHDNYPAEHYFVVVWNHGNGWQLRNMNAGAGIGALDISYDDKTGSHITTEQLGTAMLQASQYIGRKIDIYGSDACLMAMMEVAGEMHGAVDYFVGSEELEPGEGWPYNKFLGRLVGNPNLSAREVSIALTEEFDAAYKKGGVYGENSAVTFSAMDMNYFAQMESAISAFVNDYQSMSASDVKKMRQSVGMAQKFDSPDYVDLMSFLDRVSQFAPSKGSKSIDAINAAFNNFMVLSLNGGSYAYATGVSLWIPSEAKSQLNLYKKRYSKLNFNQSTNWLSFVTQLN